MDSRLDYFALDVDFFEDERIRSLIAQQGGLSLSVYIILLSRIYASVSGYYIELNNEQIIDIAILVRCKTSFVHEVIASCRKIGLFYPIEGKPYVLTSASIQRRYLTLIPDGTQITLREYRLIAETTPEQARKFPPTLSDVEEYLKQKKLNLIINAAEFWNYYAEIGWKINGEPISDWHYKCSKWAERRTNPAPKQERKQKYRLSEKKQAPEQVKCVSADQFRRENGITGSIADYIMSQSKKNKQNG